MLSNPSPHPGAGCRPRRGYRHPREEGGFDVKTHRIAGEGTAVLTENTGVIICGALGYTDRYQAVMYRRFDWERYWSLPFQRTAYRAKYMSICVRDTSHDSSSSGHLDYSR